MNGDELGKGAVCLSVMVLDQAEVLGWRLVMIYHHLVLVSSMKRGLRAREVEAPRFLAIVGLFLSLQPRMRVGYEYEPTTNCVSAVLVVKYEREIVPVQFYFRGPAILCSLNAVA